MSGSKRRAPVLGAEPPPNTKETASTAAWWCGRSRSGEWCREKNCGNVAQLAGKSGILYGRKTMTHRDGTHIQPVATADGAQRMEPRIVYMEPALWDMVASLADAAGLSRSAGVRAAVKRYLVNRSGAVKNVIGINWGESVKTSHI